MTDIRVWVGPANPVAQLRDHHGDGGVTHMAAEQRKFGCHGDAGLHATRCRPPFSASRPHKREDWIDASWAGPAASRVRLDFRPVEINSQSSSVAPKLPPLRISDRLVDLHRESFSRVIPLLGQPIQAGKSNRTPFGVV